MAEYELYRNNTFQVLSDPYLYYGQSEFNLPPFKILNDDSSLRPLLQNIELLVPTEDRDPEGAEALGPRDASEDVRLIRQLRSQYPKLRYLCVEIENTVSGQKMSMRRRIGRKQRCRKGCNLS